MSTQEVAHRMFMPTARPRRGGLIDAEDAAFIKRRDAELAAIKQRNEDIRKQDKISWLLGSDFYRTDESWPFLLWGQAGAQLRVSRYYPTLNCAVDLIQVWTFDKGQEQMIEFKRAQFKAHGIRYGVLNLQMEPAELIPQTGL
jgi:hypothetical protein